ncbi:MAG TPA: FHA domain-containing protein [Stenomitos sp.]
MVKLKLCPNCLYCNDDVALSCEKCSQDLTQIERCLGCSATILSFANFCYQCGLKLNPAPAVAPKEESTSNLDPTKGAFDLDADECIATTFNSHGVRLLHRPSSTFFDLPLLGRPIIVGKRSDAFVPDLDLRDMPQAEFISRSHAQISFQPHQFYIEDLGSKNGTAVNGVPLPSDQQQPLELGDQICLGGVEAFTFIFIKDQPINFDHLKMISGQDREFERELLRSYLSSVAALLQRLQSMLDSQAFAEFKPLASQVAIASYNVGADVMQLLAKQLEDQSQQKAKSVCEKTLGAMHEGLTKVEQLVQALYETP